MALSEDDRIKMLEGLAADESLKATQRLRALEELGKIRRLREEKAGDVVAAEDDAPYPMADLWDIELERRRRATVKRRRRSAREAVG